MTLLTYTSDGQAICAEHHLIVCDRCCVHSDGPEFLKGNDEKDESEWDRVPILEPGHNRFIPQWDDQIVGVWNASQTRRDENLPPALDHQIVSSQACSECGLTWLQGKLGNEAAISHPSHDTLFHKGLGRSRSLIVHTDGACLDNGRPTARAGIGAYFGPNSTYNVSASLKLPGVPTNQVAELHALLQAMRVVFEEVVPAREIMTVGELDENQFRLILVTNSVYAVECVCKYRQNWVQDDKLKGLKTAKGKRVVNSDVLLAIEAEVENLSRVGVQVVYYHVDRALNQDADMLAKAGADNVAQNLGIGDRGSKKTGHQVCKRPVQL